jgi:Xaa-Pro aminopeptidase
MQRKALLRERLSDLKVDAILITDPVNLRYLTGFTGSSGFSIVSENHAIFVTDFRYQEQAGKEVKGFDIRIESGERGMEIKRIVDEVKIRRLGFEADNVSYGFYKRLVGRGIRLKPLRNVIESMRVRKSKKELSYIRKAVRRAERAFRRLMPYIKVGAVERELANRLECLLKEEGCEKLPFDVIIASGPVSALPHARPTGRRLRKGDLVLIDWGGECEGYYSDMTRTFILKDKDLSRQCEIHDHVLKAQEGALMSIRPGVKAAAIDREARRYIERKGYGEYFGHGTGHGVGLKVHEAPAISWRSRDIVEEGMVFTIEPGIYLPGFGGVRIEDMVVVKDDGAEVLTGLSKGPEIIET